MARRITSERERDDGGYRADDTAKRAAVARVQFGLEDETDVTGDPFDEPRFESASGSASIATVGSGSTARQFPSTAVKFRRHVRGDVPPIDTCPNCGETDVWLEERAQFVQYGRHLCDHYWREEKDA